MAADPQGQGVQFGLGWLAILPVVTGATDGDGILRFTRLQPGTYDLQEVDATWCHAESDSVDARGQVVVAAGEQPASGSSTASARRIRPTPAPAPGP